VRPAHTFRPFAPRAPPPLLAGVDAWLRRCLLALGGGPSLQHAHVGWVGFLHFHNLDTAVVFFAESAWLPCCLALLFTASAHLLLAVIVLAFLRRSKVAATACRARRALAALARVFADRALHDVLRHLDAVGAVVVLCWQALLAANSLLARFWWLSLFAAWFFADRDFARTLLQTAPSAGSAPLCRLGPLLSARSSRAFAPLERPERPLLAGNASTLTFRVAHHPATRLASLILIFPHTFSRKPFAFSAEHCFLRATPAERFHPLLTAGSWHGREDRARLLGTCSAFVFWGGCLCFCLCFVRRRQWSLGHGGRASFWCNGCSCSCCSCCCGDGGGSGAAVQG